MCELLVPALYSQAGAALHSQPCNLGPSWRLLEGSCGVLVFARPCLLPAPAQNVPGPLGCTGTRAAQGAWASPIVRFLVLTKGQSVLTQRVGKAAAGFLQKLENSHFEAGLSSRVVLDVRQTDADPSRMIRAQTSLIIFIASVLCVRRAEKLVQLAAAQLA